MCSFASFSGLATSRLGCKSRVTLHFTGLEISWQEVITKKSPNYHNNYLKIY